MGFVIDKDVPLPQRRRGRPLVYPFADMEVGDSFGASLEIRDSVRSAARQFGERHGRKYTTITDGDGVRVWGVQ